MADKTFTFNIKAIADMKDVITNVNNIQQALSKLNLPPKLKTEFSATFKGLEKEVTNYQQLMQNGFKSKADVSALEKSGKTIVNLYQQIGKTLKDVSDTNLKSIFSSIGKEQIENLKTSIQQIKDQIGGLAKEKLNTTGFNDVKKEITDILSNSKELTQLKNTTFKTLFNNIESGKLENAKKNLETLQSKLQQFEDQPWFENLVQALELVKQQIDSLSQDADFDELNNDLNTFEGQLKSINSSGVKELKKDFSEAGDQIQKSSEDVQDFVDRTEDAAKNSVQLSSELEQVKSRIQYFLGLTHAVNLFKRAVQGAFETVKELDAAMTETAVVTDFTVSDMWEQLPEYTKRANELGVSTQAAYKAATLYYQQGLNTNEVTTLSVETLKMARIAGLEAADATDRMTNALRGFNMELNEQSAQRVNDVYSELAARTASDVDEISTAMTKVASLAHSANMEFETTSAFLTQIIETTREAPETAGTALKTIIARFTEVKKLFDEGELKSSDEEGQLIDLNKISSALRIAGIDLNKYFLGEVGLDDIFTELASKWDSLTNIQQRYIATQAAGSRQQSRFIAMMQDYARTQELVSYAYNANGASAKQFEKTQESLASKLAKLKNAWNEFLMGLANSNVIKGAVDLLTKVLNLINNLTSAAGDGLGTLLKWGTVIAGFAGLKKAFSDGGIVGKGLEALGKTSLGQKLGITTITKGDARGGLTFKAKVIEAANAFKGIVSGSGIEEALGKNLDLGLKNKFKNLFKAGGAVPAAKVGAAGAAEAAGGTAIATTAATAAIVTAVIVAVIGSVVLQDYIASGKAAIKAAEKSAEAQAKATEYAQNLYTEQEDAWSKYKEAKQTYDNAGSELEKAQAKVELNNARNNLKISDESDLQNLKNNAELSKTAKILADAQIKYAQAAAAENQKIYEQDGVYMTDSFWGTIKAGMMSSQEISDFNDELEANRQQALAEAKDLVKSAALGLAEGLTNDQDLASLIANAYANTYNESQLTARDIRKTGIEVNGQTYTTARKAYKAIYGEEALKNAKSQEIRDSVVNYANAQQEQQNLDVLLTYGKTITGKNLLEALNGTGAIQNIDLNSEDIFKALNIDTASDEFKTLAKTLGYVDKSGKVLNDKLLEQIKVSAQNVKDIQKVNKSRIFQKMSEAGLNIDKALQDAINSMSPENTEQAAIIAENAQSILSDKDYQSLLKQIPKLNSDQLENLQSLFNKIDLSNPINSFKILNDDINDVDSSTKNWSRKILEANSSIFDTGNLFQSFVTSADFDELTESLSDFITENGKISASNVNELANKCSSLNTILQKDKISATGLAKALTALQQGNAPIEGLTTRVLEALSATENFGDMIDEVSDIISNFDPGTDFGEGVDFIVDQAEKLSKLVDGFEFGNEQTANIYNQLFGEDAYQTFMSEWGNKGIEQYAEEAKNRITQLAQWAENNSYGFMRDFTNQLGIQANGEFDFIWDTQGRTTAQLTQEVADAAQVSMDTAKMLIEGWAAQSYDFASELNENDYQATIKTFAADISGARVITEQELQVIASSYGKTIDEIKADLATLDQQPDITIPIIVSWQDSNGQNLSGEELVHQFIRTFGNPRDDGSAVINWSNYLQDVIDKATGNVNADALMSKLSESGLNDSQATEMADHMVSKINGKFTKTIQVPIATELEDGGIEITQEDVTIAADSMAGLQQAEDAALEAANYEIVGQKIADSDISGLQTNLDNLFATAAVSGRVKIEDSLSATNTSNLQTKINNAISSGGANAVSNIQSLLSSTTFTGRVMLTTSGTGTGATGGVVGSAASGAHILQPGEALTGEEGEEIVWNKEKGYSYITGSNGPEFQNLQPGDRVFNATETRKILKNSSFAKGGLYGSYSSGGYNRKIVGDNSGSGSGSGDGGNGNGTNWRNELDWLYNLMEDIAELERQQNEFEEKHDLALENIYGTGRDLYNLTKKELNNLYTQLDNQQMALSKRLQEMDELIGSSGYSNYVWWNANDQTLEIDWDAIEAIQDKDTYDEISDLINRAEKVQDQIDDASAALLDIEKEIKEIEKRYLDEYTDFQNRVLDAVKASYQAIIDNYSDLSDALSDTNSSILNSIQEEIDLERQIRDNTKTEQDITDLQTRLAFLRRDTSGANATEIRALEKQISEALEGYEDTLVDQELNRLSEANDKAEEQRQQQIEILQTQLEYWIEQGMLWDEVGALMSKGIDSEGSLIINSDLEKLLKDTENWKSLSETQKQVWGNELITTVNQVGAYLLKISEGMDTISQGVWATIPAHSIAADKIQYATGGLNTFTGPAWLDGTPSEPEYVLNARQTDAFLRLADVLPSAMNGSNVTNTFGGSVYLNLTMNVDEIGNDYDVDKIADRVKDIIYDASSYRNVNTLNFTR